MMAKSELPSVYPLLFISNLQAIFIQYGSCNTENKSDSTTEPRKKVFISSILFIY